jgi:hypothetical protein
MYRVKFDTIANMLTSVVATRVQARASPRASNARRSSAQAVRCSAAKDAPSASKDASVSRRAALMSAVALGAASTLGPVAPALADDEVRVYRVLCSSQGAVNHKTPWNSIFIK